MINDSHHYFIPTYHITIDPSAVDKTRAAIRDLHTQIKVSIHSIEAISKRIETLRDEELQPQLVELIQGYVTHTIFVHSTTDFKLPREMS